MIKEWERIGQLFAAALPLSPARRAEFLDQACAGHPGTRSEVESLLRADRALGTRDFLRPPVAAAMHHLRRAAEAWDGSPLGPISGQ